MLVFRARCFENMQTKVQGQGNCGALRGLTPRSVVWTVKRLLGEITLSRFCLALGKFFSWGVSCQLCNSFHWLSRGDQHSKDEKEEEKKLLRVMVLWKPVVKSGMTLLQHCFYLSVFWAAEEMKTNSSKSRTEWNRHLSQLFPRIPAALVKQFGVGTYLYFHPTNLCLLNAKSSGFFANWIMSPSLLIFPLSQWIKLV